MNREDRRQIKVLMVGGPVDGRVYLVPANRGSFDVPIISVRLDENGAPSALQNPQPRFERYAICTLRGRMGTWHIGWPAKERERGYDAALCKILNKYHKAFPEQDHFCGECEMIEGEEEEIVK